MPENAAAQYEGRVERALLAKEHCTFWVAIGRTDTEWTDEEDPPTVSPGTADLDEPLVYVKAQSVHLCVIDLSAYDVQVAGVGYRFVNDVDAYTESARFLYVAATLDADAGMPAEAYRQKAVYSNLVPVAGHDSDAWLAPENVDDTGPIWVLANKTLKSFGAGEVREERTVIEFS